MMPNERQTRRYESMLFEYGTVQRTDYRGDEIKPQPHQDPPLSRQEKENEKPPTPKAEYHAKDMQTLSERGPIPFDLFIRAKDIVRTDPANRMVHEDFSQFEDQGRLEAQKTRPRLVVSPAVSMDDIEDQGIRDLLIKDVYLTTVRKATEEGVALTNYKTVRAPLPGLPAPANPITIPKLSAPYVSPEWRMDSVSWDNRQLRAHADATDEFWLARISK